MGGVAGMDLEEGVISPGGVGYDINCGVRLMRTNLRVEEIRPKLKDLVNELFQAIPSGVGSSSSRRMSGPELDELLVQGVRWTVQNGYGWDSDIDVCEENGCMKGADPGHVIHWLKICLKIRISS